MAAVRLGNRGHHGEKFRTENGRKQVPAVLGAKNQVVDVFGEGLGHNDQLHSDFGWKHQTAMWGSSRSFRPLYGLWELHPSPARLRRLDWAGIVAVLRTENGSKTLI